MIPEGEPDEDLEQGSHKQCPALCLGNHLIMRFVWDLISHIFSSFFYWEPFDGTSLESFYVLSQEPSAGIDLFRTFYPF